MINKQHGNFSTKTFNTKFPLTCCSEFIIIYENSVQVSFCGKVLPGNKTENDNSPQTRNTKYSEDSSNVPFLVWSYSPQCCSLVFRIMSLKLGRNEFALYAQ